MGIKYKIDIPNIILNRLISKVRTSINEDIFVIGGQADLSHSSKIARFRNGIWSDMGDLQTARFGHNAIIHQDQIMIVGGYKSGSNT